MEKHLRVSYTSFKPSQFTPKLAARATAPTNPFPPSTASAPQHPQPASPAGPDPRTPP